MAKNSIRNSIYTRFLLQLLLLAFIPIVLIIAVFVYQNQQNQDAKKYQVNTRVTQSIINSINNNLEFTSRITHSLLSKKELIAFLKNDYSLAQDFDNYISSIQSYVQATINADARSDIYLYMENPTIPMSMDVFYHLSDIKDTAPIAEFLENDAIDGWFGAYDFYGQTNPYLFPVSQRFIYIRKAFDYKKQFLGLIVFSIPEIYVLSFDKEQSGTVISSGHQRIINLTGSALSDDMLIRILANDSAQVQIANYLVTCEQPENFPFTIITVTEASRYGQLLGIFLLILGCFSIVSVCLCIKNLRELVAQMNQCLSAMDTSIHTNYQTRIPVTGNNEISQICAHVNLLLDQADELSRQNIRKETSNKESRIIALQHQINPHFIYNTMEVFSSRMKLHGHYEESDAMVAFANIFRYNIATSDALVPIQEEIRQMENYMHIQKLRYPLLELCNEIPQELYAALLPKFTFQPIIENAIVHGTIDSAAPLCITVSASLENDRLSVSIADNGAGMDAGQLAELNASLHAAHICSPVSSDGHSVGLANVNARLQLYFDRRSCLHISSEDGRGTNVLFTIPYKYI